MDQMSKEYVAKLREIAKDAENIILSISPKQMEKLGQQEKEEKILIFILQQPDVLFFPSEELKKHLDSFGLNRNYQKTYIPLDEILSLLKNLSKDFGEEFNIYGVLPFVHSALALNTIHNVCGFFDRDFPLEESKRQIFRRWNYSEKNNSTPRNAGMREVLKPFNKIKEITGSKLPIFNSFNGKSHLKLYKDLKELLKLAFLSNNFEQLKDKAVFKQQLKYFKKNFHISIYPLFARLFPYLKMLTEEEFKTKKDNGEVEESSFERHQDQFFRNLTKNLADYSG